MSGGEFCMRIRGTRDYVVTQIRAFRPRDGKAFREVCA
jgi:hypothetical protein